MLTLKTFLFNPLSVNCYVVHAENGETAIIDPACYNENEQQQLIDYVQTNRLKVKHLILTHFHFDHLMGAAFAVNHFGIPLSAHKDFIFLYGNFDVTFQSTFFGFTVKQPPKPKVLLDEDDEIALNGYSLKVLHVPGHSPCGIALYSKESKFVISGDSLFEGVIGRTDLLGGNTEQLLHSIQTKMFVLPDYTIVYPGHGNSTTIEQEKKYNVFFQ